MPVKPLSEKYGARHKLECVPRNINLSVYHVKMLLFVFQRLESYEGFWTLHLFLVMDISASDHVT